MEDQCKDLNNVTGLGTSGKYGKANPKRLDTRDGPIRGNTKIFALPWEKDHR